MRRFFNLAFSPLNGRVTGRRPTVTFGVPALVGILLASTSIALAHSTRWEWTASKAEQIVVRDAAVRLPPPERGSLENELRMWIRRYQALELATREDGRIDPVGAIYRSLAFRYRSALRKVRSGLQIDAAECTGSGAAVRAGRFMHFRCSVRSEALVIPSAVLVSSDEGKLPAVVEGPPRIVGPLEARLSVRVTGKSAIAFRRIA